MFSVTDADGTEHSFNRTFMELKQEKAIADAQAAYVLIVPLWN